MNLDWLGKASLFLLLPTLLVAYFMFISLQVSDGRYVLWTGDFVGCHSQPGVCGYAPAIGALGAIGGYSQAWWGALALFLVIWAPFVLMWHLTRAWANCAMYFYATGIPYWFVWGGLLPQAGVLVLTLLTVAFPWLLLGTFTVASMAHAFGGASVLLGFVVGIWIYWKKSHTILVQSMA